MLSLIRGNSMCVYCGSHISHGENVLSVLIVTFSEIISVSFVHWTDYIWQQFPATNKLWLIIIPSL